MKEFVFAEYVKEVKHAIKGKRAAERVISDLYGLVAIPAELDDKNGETVSCSKPAASNILHRRANAKLVIQAHSQDAIVVNSIEKNYRTRFKGLFHDAKLPHCLDAIREAIEDSDLHGDRKHLLLSKFSKDDPWEFLGLAYLEVVTIDNKLKEETEPSPPNVSSCEIPQTHRLPSRPNVERPEVISDDEEVYVAALLEAYGEAEGRKDFSMEDLAAFPKRLSDLDRHRESYYAAEEVRRGVRDVYPDDEPDQFEVFKNEIFRAIEIIYYIDHDSGLTRLQQVLSQASLTPIQKSRLCADTGWIDALEKRGVCHFLVNDGTLPGWVNVDG